MKNRVKHIKYIPAEPEPFYVPSGEESALIYMQRDDRRLIFEYEPPSAGFVSNRMSSCVMT